MFPQNSIFPAPGNIQEKSLIWPHHIRMSTKSKQVCTKCPYGCPCGPACLPVLYAQPYGKTGQNWSQKIMFSGQILNYIDYIGARNRIYELRVFVMDLVNTMGDTSEEEGAARDEMNMLSEKCDEFLDVTIRSK
jgi:hypothetical protein